MKPTQAAEIATLKEAQKNMAEKIDDLKQVVTAGFSDIKEEFMKFREEADKKYASKLTETIVYGLVGIILVAVVTALIALVIK